MSQNVEVVDVESIEIGRRIKEILDEKKQEKGNAFSIRGFSSRIGIGKNILHDIVRGLRPVRPSELEKIAQGLGTTVARLKRTDSKQRMDELVNLVKKRTNFHRALELASELLLIALGYTERFEVLNHLGIVYYYLKRYKEAEQSYLQALANARNINELFNDNKPLYKVTTNLVIVYSESKNFKTLECMLEQVEPTFEQFPPRYAGTLSYSLGMIAFNIGNMVEYKQRMYDSLRYFKLTNDPRIIGRAEHTVANTEYVLGNYQVAKEYFGKAIETLSEFPDLKYISVKDYVKALLNLGFTDDTTRMINDSLCDLSWKETPVLVAKFLMLKAYAANDPESAMQVLAIEAGADMQLMACEFLMGYCSKRNDSEGVMKYYKLAENFKSSTSKNWEGI